MKPSLTLHLSVQKLNYLSYIYYMKTKTSNLMQAITYMPVCIVHTIIANTTGMLLGY